MSEVPNLKIRVLTNPDQVADFWAWLTRPGRRMVACDTETTGIDWWGAAFKVRLAQFGDVEGGWAIPYEGWSALVHGALDWCARARVKVVFHNVSADALFLRAMGYDLDWSNVEDTMVWTGVTGFNEQHRGLKESMMREFGPWAGAGERVLKGGMKEQGWSWADVPMGWKPYPLYGVVDTCGTAALWELYDSQGRRSNPVYAADHALEIAAMRLTGDMAWRGTPIDGDYIANEISELQDEEDELRDVLKSYGVTNPNQNGQLEAALKAEGFDLASKTASGVAKLDKDVLKHIEHPAARATERFRFVTRMKGTYLGAMWSNAGGALGRGIMHPGIKPFEARTGRMAVENPPLQQLPADDDTARRAVIAREDDEVVLSSDFGQIELRLWGHIFKDERMLQRLHEVDATGEDFFVLVGKDIYGDPSFKKADPRRTKIKSTIYAKMFAGGIETAAATAGVGVYELVPVWKELEAAYPSLKTVGQDDIKTVKTARGLEHSLTSPFGRTFKVLDPGERRKLPNYVTQGTAAIALKKAIVGLEAAGFGPHMVLPVHDEVVFSVPKHEADEAAHEIAEVMDQVIREEDGWGVSVKAKVGMGANWGEAK